MVYLCDRCFWLTAIMALAAVVWWIHSVGRFWVLFCVVPEFMVGLCFYLLTLKHDREAWLIIWSGSLRSLVCSVP